MKSLKKFAIGLFSVLALGAAFAPVPARAESPAAATRAQIQKSFGFVPGFLKEVPDQAIPGAWQELFDLEIAQNTALPCKIKELIGLAVAAQIPCKYCIYAHTEFAKVSGASRVEIGEAVTMSALTRHWSTVFNGVRLDEARFQADVQRLISAAKSAKPGAAPPPPIRVVDAASALVDIKQSFGFVPEFVTKVPKSALPGAWLELRDVELNPATALPSKYKSLIGLAVSSQIPCKYCITADTEFAKLDGASEAEIAEAVTMAALVRHWSTFLNGLMIDEAQHRRDVDRLVAGVRSQMSAAVAKAAPR